MNNTLLAESARGAFRITSAGFFLSRSTENLSCCGWKEGVEPSPTDPQTVVLPLHHIHHKRRFFEK